MGLKNDYAASGCVIRNGILRPPQIHRDGNPGSTKTDELPEHNRYMSGYSSYKLGTRLPGSIASGII